MFTSIDQAQPAPADRQGRAPTAPARDGGRDRRRIVAAAFDSVYVGRFAWRWRWMIAATTALGLLAGIAFAVSTAKTYVAAASILLDPRDLKVVKNEVAPNALPSDATLALIESQTAVAMSDRVLSDVIRKAGLAADPEFSGRQRDGIATLLPDPLARFLEGPPTEAAELAAHVSDTLRRATTVVREPKSFIINLAVTTRHPEKSAWLANLVAETFIGEIGRIQSDTARRATVALSSRLDELRRSVVEAEGRVEDYKSRNALIGVNGRLVDDEYITRSNEGLARIRSDIAALRVKADSLRQAGVEDVVRGGLPEELGSQSLARLRQNHAELSQEAAGLATKLGSRHPRRIEIDGALAVARDSIRRELGRIVASGQTELARAQATERDLTKQIDELKTKQVRTSASFVKLRELEREVEASRAVYEAFLLRARETSEQESLNTANVRVISEATPPLRSAGPSRKLTMIAGTLGGFVFGAALVVGMAMLRLVVGYLRQDRRDAAGRAAWTPTERAARRQETEGSPQRSRDGWRTGEPRPQVAVAREQKEAPAVPVLGDPASSMDRSVLRERIRLIGARHEARSAARPPEDGPIARELRSVRDALADIRARRLSG